MWYLFYYEEQVQMTQQLGMTCKGSRAFEDG
jgi:hypothetical protein